MNNGIVLSDLSIDERVIIFGAASIARGVIQTLKALPQYENRNIIGCMVTSKKINPKEIEGVRVYEIYELSLKYPDALVILAIRNQYKEHVRSLLKENGFNRIMDVDLDSCIDILKRQWIKICNPNEEFIVNIDDAVRTPEEMMVFFEKQLKRNVLNFEVSLCEHCNLNCQSCNHFSPLAEKKYIDVNELDKDLCRLVELFGEDIGRVVLMGGEPLLHPNLEAVMQVFRKHIKKSTIYFISNGLCFPKMDLFKVKDLFFISRE